MPEYTHWIWTMNLHLIEKPTDEDLLPLSNAAEAAYGLIFMYRELDGISDEMSDRDIRLVNEAMSAVESAAEVLRERDLL